MLGIKIYGTINSPVIVGGRVKVGSMKEYHKLCDYEKEALKEIFGPKNYEVRNMQYFITSNFVIYALCLVVLPG
jgi:hypothetical protein